MGADFQEVFLDIVEEYQSFANTVILKLVSIIEQETSFDRLLGNAAALF